MGPLDRIVAAAALVGLLAAAAMPSNAGTGQAPGFLVYHVASPLEGKGFREVFQVHNVSAGFTAAKADVRMLVNGEPINVTWERPGGAVKVGDRFTFPTLMSDQKMVLTGEVGGRQVMRCLFGIGAGLGISPEIWYMAGQGHQVKCLELLDDQFDPGEGPTDEPGH